jgi:tetratricopeptide (TPR) repeat protein
MSNGKSKGPDPKSAPAPYKMEAARKPEAASPPPAKQPPLFRPTDWLAFGATTLLLFTAYFLTLCPDLSLEDSGELAVASYYAGIPHPPGYPFWTLCTWLISHLLPISNIAFRVAIFAAISGSVASGLVALVVSRGSSMMIEGIPHLKDMDRRWENTICLVSGFVAGMLIGFNGYNWSQSVIVEVYSTSMLTMMAMVACLLRWIYAPHQRRYVYLVLFLFGLCITNHQTILVAAMGLEVAILVGDRKLGRDLLLGNSIVYVVGLIAKQQHILTGMDGNPAVFFIYNCIGVLSMVGCGWLSLQTRKLGTEWKAVLICGILWLVGAGFYLWMPLAGMSNPPMQWGYPRTVEGFFHALSRGQYEKTQPTDLFSSPFHYLYQIGIMFDGVVQEFDWLFALLALVPFFFFLRMQKRERSWMVGLFALYFCMGFFLLILLNPAGDRQSLEVGRVQFTASHYFIALFIGYGLTLIAASMATHYQRLRWWFFLGGIVAVDFSLYSLTISSKTLLGDVQSVSEASVYGFWKVACWVAVAVFLSISSLERFRQDRKTSILILLPLIVVSFGLTGALLLDNTLKLDGLVSFFNTLGLIFNRNQYGLPVFADLLLLGIAVLFTVAVLFQRQKAPLALTLAVFALMPANTAMNNWADNEQRGHLFGFWFGHDMFTPPFAGPDGKLSYDPKLRAEMSKNPEKAKLIYPEMTRDAVLYGGTDPGRFCPTYMIFDESFIPPAKRRDPNFDRRDVYIITQNALADGTYLMYIRAHYNRSQQYQYDTPFFQELVRGRKEREFNYQTNLVARMVSPLDTLFIGTGDRIERSRRAGSSLFKETDFLDFNGLAGKLRKPSAEDPLSAYLFDNLSPQTRQLLATGADSASARRALAEDLNLLLERELLDKKRANQLRNELDTLYPDSSQRDLARKTAIDTELASLAQRGPLYTPERFQQVKLPDTTVKFVAQNPQSHSRIRLNRLLLEAAYPTAIAKSLGGVYPDREIYIATPDDSARCFRDYMDDAQKRLNHDRQHPNEPPQIKGGENVTFDEASGRVQVSGQVAVMAINGLITKVMFDANPDHEFFVEESFPLDWMYPHLTPFGIIMKINRQPLPELTEDIVRRDHEFWSQYSERLVGNWIKYETPVKEICDFAERVYLRRDFSGFKGDLKFVRDDQAQKAFSKLRSSIGGVYMWRVNDCARRMNEIQAKSPAERQALAGEMQLLSQEQQRMIKEADFTFRQSFAYCPYSPEAVFRYISLLGSVGRLQDALYIAQTCQKFDPENGQINGLINNLRQAVDGRASAGPMPGSIEKLEATYRAHPEDFQNALNLASASAQAGLTNRTMEILDALLHDPKADVALVTTIAQAYASFGNLAKLETTLKKLIQLSPDAPEPWYDLAALKANFNQTAEALTNLNRAIQLNTRRTDKPRDIRAEAGKDPRFAALTNLPEFRKIVGLTPL